MLKGYITVSILLIADLALYLSCGISLTGQLSDKVLFWTWLIMTPIITFKYFKSSWTKLYLGIIGILIVLSLIPMAIPFISIVGFASGMDNERLVNEYKLREGSKSAIAIPKIYLLKQWGVFEREIGETEFQIEIGDIYYRVAEFEKIVLTEEENLVFEFKIGNNSATRTFKIE